MLLLGCGGSARGPAPSSCANSCETNDWPRLVLGVTDQRASDAGTQLEAGAETDDGWTGAFDRNGVPRPWLTGCICSYSTGATPRVRSIRVHLKLGDVEVEHQVELGEFNYCGRDIAYLPIRLETDESPQFGDVEYISPCSTIAAAEL